MKCKIISVALVIFLSLLSTGCRMIQDNSFSVADESDPSASPSSLEPVYNIKDGIIGTWVATQYKGIDGKTQDLDTSDPAKKITYTFDASTVTLVWGDQHTQTGTYEWYVATEDVYNILVHFNAASSEDGTYHADAADVHFNITYFPDSSSLTIKIQESGEEFTLKKG